MTNMLDLAAYKMLNQFYKLQENKGALTFVFVLIILLIFAYAFYCTSKGFNFAGEQKVSKVGTSYKIGCWK